MWRAMVLSALVLAGCSVHSLLDMLRHPSMIVDPVDSRMGEPWLGPNLPPPHQQRPGTPNAALMADEALWRLIERADPVNRRVFVALKEPGKNRGWFRG